MEIGQQTLYCPELEHDACGIGAVVNIKGISSHKIVDDALQIVEKLEHRAGKDASGETGDGVGILLQISHEFFKGAAEKCGIHLKGSRLYGVGMFFFPRDRHMQNRAMKMFETIAQKEGLRFLGWRPVPVNEDILGSRARECMPGIYQCFIERPENIGSDLDFERRLYIVRRVFEKSNSDTYTVSLSCRTIVYKGMFLVGQLRKFYLDLQDDKYVSAMAMVHSRFSTNTNPSWERAHPNRIILHNGEINTIRGNVDRMLTREETMKASVWRDDMEKVLPCIDTSGSDSAMLDNTLEFLMMSGMPLPLAVMITVPEPFRNREDISREKRDFYHYYSTMMEPWDGPAAIIFSDGDMLGAALDRNGLRPARYCITDDDTLILSSEVGVLPIPEENIILKSRLAPGKMLLVDMKKGKVISDEECKNYYAARNPYGEWLDQNLVKLASLPIPNKKPETHPQELRDRLYKAFGFTYESIKEHIIPMAKNGSEPITSMGVDIPLAVLSDKHQPLFNYFKQMFAQVTNPPIDAIREEIVTDTVVYVGSDGNLLDEKAQNCNVLEIRNPILTNVDMMKIKSMKIPGLKVETISLLYYTGTPMKTALDNLFIACEKAYKNGCNVIVLSDRGIDENHMAIPSLLAVSAMEQYLVRTKKRTAISVILESGEPREVHHFATLLGYGARAVNPYLVEECIAESIEKGLLDKDCHTAVRDYNEAVLHGIVKIASKMGISTLLSYQSAQIFEIVGIDKDVVDTYFTNTISRVGGIGLREIAEDVEYRHAQAFDQMGLGIDTTIESGGAHRLRTGEDKEDHLYNPSTIVALRDAVQNGNYQRFKEYSAMIDDERKPHTLRGLLDFVPAGDPVPIDEVESAQSIVKRFKTGAMSYGSISKEAHECLAVAMNRIGGKSNSGEGGEEPERLGTERQSSIKQVASGRFGVTEEYLLSAVEIQIKMAQGAKPGEGGHLPGEKVYPWIAKTRHSTPGVSLISPPPHHDIYSIEDLAQLIYDLKNANRRARISVKLVSEAGVGTIASGVAKAGAQVILISGYDGGTGAAPASSIHNAGLPWELGIAETHQTLIQNGLRSKVVLETDGKLMTGRDVAIAAMLGAEEFGFATAPLVTMGCLMLRVCNLDTCSVGIATQDPELRCRFAGKPEYVINFMMYIAQELREIMASLGVRSVDELVGRTDLLRVRENTASERQKTVDLSKILNQTSCGEKQSYYQKNVFDFRLQDTIDERVFLPEFEKAIESGERKEISVDVSSTNRAVGTILGSVICEKHKGNLDEDTYVVNCFGGGGQSFGAFIPKGLTLRLSGDSNDYFGKGLSGGKLVLSLPKNSKLKAEENIILGNVALYGATSGEAYINGIAGERFCVRNSGAIAVVEGVGDHGCEYMTGGIVCVLGRTGKNFAAGMSGGIAYVLDEKHDLYKRLNKELVRSTGVEDEEDIETLRRLIEKHTKETSSELGRRILSDFDKYLPMFKKIIPNDYSEMLKAIEAYEKQGYSHEEAQFKAFYELKSTKREKTTRKENHSISAKERIANFCEFHPPLDEAERRKQAARCMNCGVPFCQSGISFDGMVTGCPLHNLIPEWNYQAGCGNAKHALSRLLKTNNFPEFTGRVCPAPCEAACTNGLNTDPVTIRENELWIIENAFDSGYMQPRIPKVRSGKKVAVVGSGPAGLAAADCLNQRGHSVTVYERDDRPGGLLMYGIPNMKLDKEIVGRRIALMHEEGIKFVTNADVGRSISADELLAEYDAVILACGAKKARNLPVNNKEIGGVYFAVDFLASTTKSLLDSGLENGSYIDAKDKHVVIVGGGDTGNDCVGTCIRHGCASVRQIEMMPAPPKTRDKSNPWPRFPRVLKTDYGQQEAIEVFGEDPRMFATTVSEIITNEDGNICAVKTVQLTPKTDEATGRVSMVEIPNTESTLEADILIIAAGFIGCEEYVPNAFGASLTPRGTVATAGQSYMTHASKVFSCGDMRMGQSLVVHAINEGRLCAKQVDAFLMG